MLRLAIVLHTFIGTSAAGAAVIAVLVMGYMGMMPILWAALAGFLVSIPLTWMVAKTIYDGS
ncbi:CTP synthetase [Roseovarius sp. SCSIO 43702]|nr:CTP synthetase [Roseovarius sp. SCSIO 43702]